MSIFEAVRQAYNLAGLSLLPVRADGSKAPDVETWRAFTETRPTVAQMRAWRFADRHGFGMVAGPASGYRECWDFDTRECFDAFVRAAVACGLEPVVIRIRAGYEDETPGGGRRWIVGYDPSLAWKDCTLARRPGRDGEPSVKVLIELPTYSVLAPSDGPTHPSGRPYVRVSGSFATIPQYTRDERAALIALAQTFDEMPVREAAPSASSPQSLLKPGSDFNARAAWSDVLPDWTEVYRRDRIVYLRRPGKDRGVSATINARGTDRLHVFTSSTPLAAETSYSKFGAYAFLQHGGDFAAAAAALAAQGYGERRTTAASYTRPAVVDGIGQCLLAPCGIQPYNGWFARGAVHMVAGSSGAGKTTLLLDLLRTQARPGGRYLGHAGAQLEYLVVFADRGTVSNAETLRRMRIDPATLPVAHLPATTSGADALRVLRETVEHQEPLPAAVFVEGADLLVEDPCKSQVVTPFVVGLRLLAERYALAVILSVGAPKARPQEQYALARDRVYGSQAWSRLSNTVLVLNITGDGTVATRDLVVLHRNAPAEKFHLTFADGMLVETGPRAASDEDMRTWITDTEIFTKQRFREAFGLSGTRSTELLNGYVAVKLLKVKVRNDRTVYVLRRPGPGSDKSETGSDDFGHAQRRSEIVPDDVRTDSQNQTPLRENVSNSAPEGVDPLIPPICVRSSESTPLSHTVSDERTRFRGYTRAREADDLPAWVTEVDAPLSATDSDAPFADHDEDDGASDVRANATAGGLRCTAFGTPLVDEEG